ncbi:hypothetical protein [Ruminococcus sp.]|uniref:hypothetical protein n=1 Tax=Ruminococcus sp. TaxID=41978 RepID=UPI0025FB748E|nr:hypothetical protein [Ruminococcus sp.]
MSEMTEKTELAIAEKITDRELALIRQYASGEVTAEQLFVFKVNLCDNDIDRDGEKFASEALEGLAELFTGRTGIFDHDPKSGNQSARIFECWVETIPEKLTADGEVYRRLMARAYMVRTQSNGDLIKEIEGGIKKEVSVSCSMMTKVCSICGADQYEEGCCHEKGREYGRKLCFHLLDQPLDAYEWSFVAVPAQVHAGVTKRFSQAENKYSYSDRSEDIDLARKALTADVLRLSYFCKPYMTAKRVGELAEMMTIKELIGFRKKLEEQVVDDDEVYEAEKNSFLTGDYKV